MPRYSAIGLALILGCAPTTTQPSDALTGTWGGSRAELKANTNESVLRFKCLTTRLAAIVPDAEGHFDVTGTVTKASWGGAVGHDFRVEGTISGSVMTIVGRGRFTEEWTDPVSFTMYEGVKGDFSGGFCIV